VLESRWEGGALEKRKGVAVAGKGLLVADCLLQTGAK